MKQSLIRLNRNLQIVQSYLAILQYDIRHTSNRRERKGLRKFYKFFEALLETLLQEKEKEQENQNSNQDDDDEDDNNNNMIRVVLM